MSFEEEVLERVYCRLREGGIVPCSSMSCDPIDCLFWKREEMTLEKMFESPESPAFWFASGIEYTGQYSLSVGLRDFDELIFKLRG